MVRKILQSIQLILLLCLGIVPFFEIQVEVLQITQVSIVLILIGLQFIVFKIKSPKMTKSEISQPEKKEFPQLIPEKIDSETTIVEPSPLEEPLAIMENLFPVLENLSQIVSKKIEFSAQRLGNEIFHLSETMNSLGTSVGEIMAQFSEGDHSLAATIGSLKEKIQLMDCLEKVFGKLQSGFKQSISALKKTSTTIHDFSENISDLADQTNILAINASIEAARVGMAGKGFAVIASQVQFLSKQSKDLAEKMTVLMKDVVVNMEQSFENNSKSIIQSVDLISEGKKDMSLLIDALSPQVTQIHGSMESSKNLVTTVASDLKAITIDLQFQDITKQILDHIISILFEVRKTILEDPQNHFDLEKMKSAPFRTKAHELAASFFTVDDEWQTVGIDPLHIKNRLKDDKKVLLF